jgi:hypothetical protein
MSRRPLNLGTKSVEEKLGEIEQEAEIIPSVNYSFIEEQQAMKKFNLAKARKSSRVDIDEDLHREFKIAAIKNGKTQKGWLEELIREAVRKI